MHLVHVSTVLLIWASATETTPSVSLSLCGCWVHELLVWHSMKEKDKKNEEGVGGRIIVSYALTSRFLLLKYYS